MAAPAVTQFILYFLFFYFFFRCCSPNAIISTSQTLHLSTQRERKLKTEREMAQFIAIHTHHTRSGGDVTPPLVEHCNCNDEKITDKSNFQHVSREFAVRPIEARRRAYSLIGYNET